MSPQQPSVPSQLKPALADPQNGIGVTKAPDGQGAEIDDVVNGSNAQAAGLQPGDEITAVNSNPIFQPGDTRTAQQALDDALQPFSGGTATLWVTNRFTGDPGRSVEIQVP
jgi:S1-C subfamily serine protease